MTARWQDALIAFGMVAIFVGAMLAWGWPIAIMGGGALAIAIAVTN